MKVTVYILVLTFFIIRCSNTNKDLVVVENDYEVNLTELDSVRENLRGFWIPESKKESNELLWLEFSHNINSTTWQRIIYNKKNEKTKTLTSFSCPPFIKLIKPNETIQIEFVSLYSPIDTIIIEKLTKTKLKISGDTYLKHKGYDFLKNWK